MTAQSYDLAHFGRWDLGAIRRHGEARSADADDMLSVDSAAVLGTVTFQLDR